MGPELGLVSRFSTTLANAANIPAPSTMATTSAAAATKTTTIPTIDSISTSTDSLAMDSPKGRPMRKILSFPGTIISIDQEDYDLVRQIRYPTETRNADVS